MGIRFDASTEGLERTANLPSATAVTACGFARRQGTGGSGASSCLFGLRDAGYGEWLGVYTDAEPGNLEVSGGGGAASTQNIIAHPADGTWFFWACTNSGTVNNLLGYYRALGSTALTVSAAADIDAFTPTVMMVGNDGSSSDTELYNGDFYAIRVWDAVLTQDELLRESFSAWPVRLQNLNDFWWLNDSTAIGLRGLVNNRNWTSSGGTPADAENAPIRLRASRRRLFVVPASGPANDISAAGTLSITGSADLDATGLLAAAGTLSITGAADLDARGSVAAAGALSITGSADLDARGVLVAAGTLAINGSADLTEAAGNNLSAAGSLSISGAADLDARGSLAAAGTVAITGAADLDARGTLAAAGALSISGAADLDARGTLAAAGSLSISGNAELTEAGTSNITATGSLSITGSAALKATGKLQAAGTLSISGAASLGYSNDLQAVGSLVISGSADLDARGSLSAAGQIAIFGAAFLVDANAGAPNVRKARTSRPSAGDSAAKLSAGDRTVKASASDRGHKLI